MLYILIDLLTGYSCVHYVRIFIDQIIQPELGKSFIVILHVCYNLKKKNVNDKINYNNIVTTSI